MPVHKEYRAKWVAAGYDPRMGSAWVCLPPEPDKLRLYHFTTAEHAMTNLEKGRMKVARFADCNDPFELLALNFRASAARQTGRNFKREVDTTTGFLSFSRNWTESLMWSHYADRHKGICLGFDLPRVDLTAMEYNDVRLLKKLDKNADPTKLPSDLKEALLKIKAKSWFYELEVRRYVQLADMDQEGALHFYPFDDSKLRLREVIIGDRCPIKLTNVRRHLRVHHRKAVVCHARLAFGSFSVVPDERTIP